MDIHLNVWSVSVKNDGPLNVGVLFRETDSRNKVIGHMSRAAAKVLVEDLGKLLDQKEEADK